MIRILADENFHGAIMRGLLHRVLLTHDVKTITRFAYKRLAAGLPLPGILEVPQDMNIGQAVEEILLMAECMPPEEWQDRIYYLPL